MTNKQLASNLVTWSKRNIQYKEAIGLAERYKAGTLGDGLIKDYFDSLFGVESLKDCSLKGCSNKTTRDYCEDCLNLTPDSKASELFLILSDLLKARQSM